MDGLTIGHRRKRFFSLAPFTRNKACRRPGAAAVALLMLLIGLPRAAAQECHRLPPVMFQQPTTIAPASYDELSRRINAVAPADQEGAAPRPFADDATGNNLRPPFQEGTLGLSPANPGSRGPGSDDALIDRAEDPTSWLMSYRFRDQAVFPVDKQQANSDVFEFRAQIPFKIWDQVNLMRLTVPYNVSGPNGSGLSSATLLDLLVFDAPWGHWGVGPDVQLNPNTGSQDSFEIGPAFGAVSKSEHWTAGFLVQNFFSNDSSESQIQPILAYKFNDRLALGVGDMKFTYSWSEGRWTQVPLGCELDYIADVRGQKMQLFANPQYNFQNSSGKAEWMLYFGIVLLVPTA